MNFYARYFQQSFPCFEAKAVRTSRFVPLHTGLGCMIMRTVLTLRRVLKSTASCMHKIKRERRPKIVGDLVAVRSSRFAVHKSVHMNSYPSTVILDTAVPNYPFNLFQAKSRHTGSPFTIPTQEVRSWADVFLPALDASNLYN